MSTRKSNKYRGRIVRPRGQSWQVDFGTQNGQRIQRSFPSLDDAKIAIDEFVDQKALQRIDQRNKRVAVYDLTDRQRMDILTAMERLNGRGSLTEAADYYLSHTEPEGGSRTVSQVIEEYLEAKRLANRRERTIGDIKARMGHFASEHGEENVHDITTRTIEMWLNKHEYKQTSRLNYRTVFVGFFNFAKKRRYIQDNPATAIERPIMDEKTVEILTVREAEQLMQTAENEAPEMVPYFGLCLFAGIRPAEAVGLDWRNVDLINKLITVRPQVAKKRRQRLVSISDNLAQWLAPYRRDSGAIRYTRHEFERVRDAAGIHWAADIMRHSFGSYHLAIHEDASKTALQMGHFGLDVLFNHYRELVRREDAEKFWNIHPVCEANVIRMRA